MGLFSRGAPVEERSISYQDVWGADLEWASPRRYRVKEAIELSTVIGCVRLRANTASQLPFAAFTADADGISQKIRKQPALVESPSMTVARSTWVQQCFMSRDLWGYAAGYITARDGLGFATNVEWLPPQDLTQTSTSHGKYPLFSMKGRTFAPEDLLIIPSTFVLPGDPLGIAPLARTGLVDLNKKARDFGADWFRNGAVPSSVITTPEPLTQEQADAMADRAASKWRRRKPAVMGSGMTLDVLKMNAEESQFLETLRHVQVDICQAFGVPPEKLGISSSGSSVTYANREQQQTQFLIDGMNADLVVIQEVLSNALIGGRFVRFNTGALLRSDVTQRYAAYKTAIDGGFMDPDEARAFEDWGPLDRPEQGATDDD